MPILPISWSGVPVLMSSDLIGRREFHMFGEGPWNSG